MSDKFELTADEACFKLEQQKQQKQREFEALLKEVKKKQAMLKSLELSKRVATTDGLTTHYPKAMAVIKDRNMAKARLAHFNKNSGINTNDGKLKAKLEARFKKLDAAVNDILANLDKNIPATNVLREITLKAIRAQIDTQTHDRVH